MSCDEVLRLLRVREARYAGPVCCRQAVEGLGPKVLPRRTEVIRHRSKKAVAASG